MKKTFYRDVGIDSLTKSTSYFLIYRSDDVTNAYDNNPNDNLLETRKMITKSKSNKLHHTKKHKQRKHDLQIDVGKPKVPLHKICQRGGEKLEDWLDAP